MTGQRGRIPKKRKITCARSCAEFQGPPDEARCEEYQTMLINEGKDDLVEQVECSALFFDKEHVGFWLISIYFVVVTLTTCAPQQ